MTIKAVLFDKDGTLIDFNATYGPSTGLILKELSNGDPTLENAMAEVLHFDLVQKTIGPDSVVVAGSLENIAEKLLPLTTETDVTALGNHLDMLYIKYAGEIVEPIEGLFGALDALKEMGLSLGVATNDSESAAHSHLNEISIGPRFEFIAGYDSGHGAKPGPGMVLAFAQHLGLEPEQVAMVGDSTHDCNAGRAAGAVAIGVTSGLADVNDLSGHADWILPGIAALPAFIKEYNQQGGTV